MQINDNTIIEIKGLKKYFPIKSGVFKKITGYVRAVDDVNLKVEREKTLGIIGESGCGKTTLGRCILRLLNITEGEVNVSLDGKIKNITKLKRSEMKSFRNNYQIVFQNPDKSLSDNQLIYDILGEPLKVHGIHDKKIREKRIVELLEAVNLGKEYMYRYPHQLSGGQRQRISIARSLTVDPKVIVCDEPVSALDISVQAQVLNLLKNLQKEYGITYILIGHDLAVMEYMSDEIAVMYLGKVVEQFPVEKLVKCLHPYTQALVSSIKQPDPKLRTAKKVKLKGEVPSLLNLPSGCKFHPRCKYATDICKKEEPKLVLIEDEHYVSCHNVEKVKKSS